MQISMAILRKTLACFPYLSLLQRRIIVADLLCLSEKFLWIEENNIENNTLYKYQLKLLELNTFARMRDIGCISHNLYRLLITGASAGGLGENPPPKCRKSVIFQSCSSLYRISRMGGGPGRLGEGYFFTLEKSKISHFLKLENFQKMLKNQWKFYNFLKIYM